MSGKPEDTNDSCGFVCKILEMTQQDQKHESTVPGFKCLCQASHRCTKRQIRNVIVCAMVQYLSEGSGSDCLNIFAEGISKVCMVAFLNTD